jgi:hypothetical protein
MTYPQLAEPPKLCALEDFDHLALGRVLNRLICAVMRAIAHPLGMPEWRCASAVCSIQYGSTRRLGAKPRFGPHGPEVAQPIRSRNWVSQ